MSRPVALITGPTSGLGAGFARRYARDGYDLVLVARDTARLEQLAAELHDEAGVGVEVLPADLAVSADRAKVAERLRSGVQVLVNNAAFGTSGEFWTAEFARLKAQLDVNVTAVMELTHAALPTMVEAGNGTVINVASVAGLIPGRGSTYSASKAWVVSFSEGLARAGIDMADTPSYLWLEVDDVVRECLADVAKGRVVIVPGLQYKVLTTGSRLVPRDFVRAVTRVVGKGRGRT